MNTIDTILEIKIHRKGVRFSIEMPTILKYWGMSTERYKNTISDLNRLFEENPCIGNSVDHSTILMITMLIATILGMVGVPFLCTGYTGVASLLYSLTLFSMLLGVTLYNVLPDQLELSKQRRNHVVKCFLQNENVLNTSKGIEFTSFDDTTLVLKLWSSYMNVNVVE